MSLSSDQRFSCLVISQNLAVTGPMTSTEVRCSNVTTNAVTINDVISDIIETNTIVSDSITSNTNICTTFTTDVVTDTDLNTTALTSTNLHTANLCVGSNTTAGYLLTANAQGCGTWQTAPFIPPPVFTTKCVLFDTAGTFLFFAPNVATTLYVIGIGGGGGGGAGETTGEEYGQNGGGYGGSGGTASYLEVYTIQTVPSDIIQGTVGAGGIAGIFDPQGAGGSGGDGGNSEVQLNNDTPISFKGAGGGGGGGVPSPQMGGTAGASGADYNLAGNQGKSGFNDDPKGVGAPPNMRSQLLPLLVSYGRGGDGGIQVSNGGINGIAGSSGCVFIYYNT